MSFLIEATTRRVATALPRASIAAHAPRAFSTSIVYQKSATETVKDGLKSVDRAVSDKLVDGLDVAGTFSCTSTYTRTRRHKFPIVSLLHSEHHGGIDC